MWFLLQGMTKTADGIIKGFYLASNVEEADNLDDVVFKYTYNSQDGTEKTKIIFLQAKHRDKETARRPQEKVTFNKLLSGSEADFSLQKYFTSYLRIKKQFSPNKVEDPIFGSRYEDVDCEFVIYSNALPGFTINRGGVEQLEETVQKVSVDKDSILYLSEEMSEANTYYRLSFGSDRNEEIVNALRYSAECNKLARELAESAFSKDGININNNIFKNYQIALKEKVLEIEKPRLAKFREGFLNGEKPLSGEESKFRSTFLEEVNKIVKEPSNWEEDKLKLELRSRNIKISDKFWNRENEGKLLLPNDSVDKNDIQEFLNRLKPVSYTHLDVYKRQ